MTVQSEMKLTNEVIERFRCPACHAGLVPTGEELHCRNTECQSRYPIVDGIPVVINEHASVFTLDDFRANRMTTLLRARPGPLKNAIEGMLGSDRYARLKKSIRNALPSTSGNIEPQRNYRRLSEMLSQRPGRTRVLILGGGILGDGMEALMSNPTADFIESDVSFGPRTKLICDAHDIPFEDGVFDAVIVQAVLEHVVDAPRCVDEIHRVLKPDGLVYAETPFMQQVHAGRYDFTRYTHLGHRRLFRRFEEIDSGLICGPGMALAWAYQYFLLSFVASRRMRSLVAALG